MKRSSLLLAAVASIAATACGPDYYCSGFDDLTGRPVVFCDNPRADPVCDYPGQEAFYGEGPRGLELMGGDFASCTADLEVVCPAGTVEPPRCIVDPEL